MKRAVTVLLFCFMFMFLLTSCTVSNKSSTSTTNNKSNSEVEAKEKLAKEKSDALEKKAQEGYTLFFQKKYSEAIAIEDAVIKEDLTFFKAYYIKGITECYNGNYTEGSADIDKALALNPNDYMARFNKALSLELYGHYDEALNWYNKALEIQKEEWSFYGIASIYGRRGDVENTVKYLKLAIVLNSDIKNEAKNESDFNPVKNSHEFIELVNN